MCAHRGIGGSLVAGFCRVGERILETGVTLAKGRGLEVLVC